MLLALGIIFLLLACVGYMNTRSVLSPQTLIGLVWGAFTLLFYISSPPLYEMGTRFYTALFIWVLAFSVGSYIGCGIASEGRKTVDANRTVMKWYFILAPSFCIISSVMIIKMALTSDLFFTYLRMINTGMDEDIEGPAFGVFAYLNSMMLVLLLIELGLNGLSRRKTIALLFALNILSAFITMAKSSMLMLFVSSLTVLYVRKNISKKSILILSGILLLIMILIQFARAVEGDFNLDFLSDYIFPSAVAFDTMPERIPSDFGENVFRLFYAIGHSLGICGEPVNTQLEYVVAGPGVITNVFTVMYPFYSDFGYWGVGLFGAFYGFVGGIFYKKIRNSVPALVFYAIFVATVIFQFMGDLIITNLSLYMQYLFYAYLPFWIKGRREDRQKFSMKTHEKNINFSN